MNGMDEKPTKRTRRESDDKIQFLQYAITYLDNRIHLIDTKASLLIAVQGILLGLFSFIFKQIFQQGYTSSCKSVECMVIGGTFLFVILTIISLLMTISPTKSLLNLRVGKLGDQNLRCKHAMWPIDEFHKTEKDYLDRVDALGSDDFERNYKRTHFILLQLIRKKYEYYRCSMLLMKISILWGAVGLGIVALLRTLGSSTIF